MASSTVETDTSHDSAPLQYTLRSAVMTYHWDAADQVPQHLRGTYARQQLRQIYYSAKAHSFDWEWVEQNIERTFAPSPGFREFFNDDQWFVLETVAEDKGWHYVERYKERILGLAETVLGPLAPTLH